MTLHTEIKEQLKGAMKAGETKKRDTLRLLDSAIKDETIKINKRDEGLSEDEILSVINRMVKQRRDSVEAYKAGGRDDLMNNEQEEIDILTTFLPKQLSEEEVKTTVQHILDKMNDEQKGNMGAVMGAVMKELKGKADGRIIKKCVDECLG